MPRSLPARHNRQPPRPIRYCRIAGVAEHILMHSLAYSIKGLMATMVAEFVYVISL